MTRASARRRAVAVLAFGLVAGAVAADAQPGSGVVRVATTGGDGPACGAAATPCRNPQQAVNIATATDEIRLAAGTYTYAGTGLDPCDLFAGETVICVINKGITLRGGYSTADWNASNPAANPTFLDGQSARRVIYALRTAAATRIELTDLTVRNGRNVGLNSSDDNASFAFGAGLLVDDAMAVVKRVVFLDNESVGGTTTHAGGHGGAGSGGGAALRLTPAGTTLEDVTFDGNVARGGNGTQRGGLALGGGLYTYRAFLAGSRLRFLDNSAFSGSTAGSGDDGSGFLADALGGGASFEIGSTVTLSGVLARGNSATGGNATGAANGKAGGGFGGALFGESSLPSFPTSVTVRGAVLADNQVFGGAARNGGLGAGGAVMFADATLVLDRVRMVDNLSQGGASTGGGLGGAAGGGGGYLTSSQAGAETVTIRNSIVADNRAALGSGAVSGGGGGGFFLQGVQGSLDHVTLARNGLGSVNMQGQAMVLLNGAAINFRYGAVEGHTVPAGPIAIHVQPANSITFLDGAFSGNGSNSGGGGTIQNPGEMSSFADLQFLAPGPPEFDYRIAPTSPLVDAATASSEPRDVECQPRTVLRDIGADEARPEGEIFRDAFESGDRCAWAID